MTKKQENVEHAFAKERNRLFGFIRRFIPSKEDAEDILQDVFYQLITYEDAGLIDRLTSWLYTAARNKIIDTGRKKRADSFSNVFTFNDDEELSIEDFLPSIDLTPEDSFLQDEFDKVFYAALDELPGGQKEVFVMNELEGLSFKEISDLTGISVNTLLSRKHYAVKQLKKKLDKYLNR